MAKDINRILGYRYIGDIYSILPKTIFQRSLARGEVGVLKSSENRRWLIKTNSGSWGIATGGKYPIEHCISVSGVNPRQLLTKIFYICGMFNVKQIWWRLHPEIQCFGGKYSTRCICSFILEERIVDE
jgi:hypothetical protein